MLINEAGLVRNIKSAYKHGGYTVSIRAEDVTVYSELWFIKCKRAMLPRKALAIIVEHMGMLPQAAPVSIVKDTDPQMVMTEVAGGDMEYWRSGERVGQVSFVPVTMQGYQIFQQPGGGECWGVSLSCLEMIERDVAKHYEVDVVNRDRLLWEGDGEVVVLLAVRKAASGWAKARSTAVPEHLADLLVRKVADDGNDPLR